MTVETPVACTEALEVEHRNTLKEYGVLGFGDGGEAVSSSRNGKEHSEL